MDVRRVETLIPVRYEQDVRQILAALPLIDCWDRPVSDQRIAFTLLIQTNQTETVLDELERHFDFEDEFRLIVTPVEAMHPWPSTGDRNLFQRFRLGRVSRQELYQDIRSACGITPMFLAMVVLSTVVAAAGLLQNNVAAIIGAMVIAPLLGPNAALSLAVTLGDRRLAARALSSGIAGVSLAFAMAALLGYTMGVDASIPEIDARTRITLFDLGIALAAGIAGSLAFTTGAPASLVGVMVAVALLPPTVVLGMLAGSQQWEPALGAGLILLANLTALNVAGIGAFLALGLRPRLSTQARGARLFAGLLLALWLTILSAIAVTIFRLYGPGT